MLFNSYVFPVFFLLVYGSYLLLRRHWRVQNALLLVASYVFYGWWDWRFLSLLALSTVVDFQMGRWIGRTDVPRRRRVLLGVSVVVNLTILGFFKYFNFFADSAAQLLHALGLPANPITLNVILPVGISFYTFQTLSYTIDVYRRELRASQNLFDFALFVSFFPQLVAGPIERATNLLPQVCGPRTITAAGVESGLFLILWGYFKKVVIADNVAHVANQVFDHYADYHGLDLVLGALAFTVQIYCDFSGYTDIARGLGRLMGFELMVNFRLPYFARNPSDFWARWHISLSSWLRDYLYVPLGGNRGGTWRTYRNLLLTMLLGGLWHGAAWNFVAWGGYHGALLVGHRALGGRRSRATDIPPAGIDRLRAAGQILIMFALTVFGWILFRARSLDQIGHFCTQMSLRPSAESAAFAFDLCYFATPLLIVQLIQHWRRDLAVLVRLPAPATVVLYTVLLTGLCIFGVRESVEFLYFQF